MPATPHDWERLKAVFNSLLDCPLVDRPAALNSACREHPDLAARLRVLVASSDSAPEFLEQPAFFGAIGRAEADAPAGECAEPVVLAAGDVLDDRYDVEEVLGEGGMGVVYRVRHRALARTFAAKLIHARVAADQAFLDRFTREAEALGRLKHPNIVDVTDFGIERATGPRPYLVMELLPGRTLDAHLRSGAVPENEALALFENIAAGLDHAHEQGVLHLDLKPGNIVVVPTGATGPTAKILDFGLAQFVAGGSSDSTGQTTSSTIGTPAYMAPELWDGARPGPAADIYAFGVLMYEVLTGRRPFQGSATEIARQVRECAPALPSTINLAVPAELDDALMASLARAPDARPPSAREAVALVRRARLAARRRLWRRREVPVRLALAAALAAACTYVLLLLPVPVLRALEQHAVDARFALAAARAPRPDIVLLLLDEATLQADSAPLALRADQFGRGLQRVFDAGARAVALDFLLPSSWGRSSAFAQLVVRNTDRLTLAAFSAPSGEVIGPEAVSGMITVALGEARASSLFGFVNVDQDADGVSRRARAAYRDRDGRIRRSFAARAGSTAGSAPAPPAGGAETGEFWIDHRIDPRMVDRVSWVDLGATLQSRPEFLRGRVVFVGADYPGSGDRVRVPNHQSVAGVALHALIADTILSGYPIRSTGAAPAAIAAGAVCTLLCAALLLGRAAGPAFAAAVIVCLAYAAGALVLFLQARVMVPVVGPLALWLCGAAAATALRRYRPPFPHA